MRVPYSVSQLLASGQPTSQTNEKKKYMPPKLKKPCRLYLFFQRILYTILKIQHTNQIGRKYSDKMSRICAASHSPTQVKYKMGNGKPFGISCKCSQNGYFLLGSSTFGGANRLERVRNETKFRQLNEDKKAEHENYCHTVALLFSAYYILLYYSIDTKCIVMGNYRRLYIHSVFCCIMYMERLSVHLATARCMLLNKLGRLACTRFKKKNMIQCKWNIDSNRQLPRFQQKRNLSSTY